MESRIAIQLAADVLGDHFGPIVQRVGVVLLERGSLTIQDIMRWLGQASSSVAEPLRFPHVRNALLTMMQHGFVTAKSNHVPDNDAALRVVPQVYSIDADEVLSRLRFAHYLEHVLFTYGPLAYQMLLLILQHGRIGSRFLQKEVTRSGQATTNEAAAMIQSLAQSGVLQPVTPCIVVPGEVASSEAAEASPEAATSAKVSPTQIPDISASEGSLKRKREDQTEQNANAKRSGPDLVYTHNWRVLNLCLCKSLFCRLIEERVTSHHAQVMTVLFTGVTIEHGRPNAKFMKFREIEHMMAKLEFHQPGRDPAREVQQLAKALEYLTGLRSITRRTLTSAQSRELLNSSGADNSRAGEVTDPLVEWSVEWSSVKNTLKKSVTSQLIRDQFGIAGLRIFNLLNERTIPQKLEEREITSRCMVKPEQSREILNAMALRHIVHWQEVAKRESTTSLQPFGGSLWFYYVDRQHLDICMLHDVYQALLNLRVRFRTEVANTAPLESRANSLTSEERANLASGRRNEDILERSFLVLDAALLVYRHC